MKFLFLAATAALAVVTSAAAAPVSVTDTVTGGPGAYTHVFSLTNDIGGTNSLYFFGVDLSGTITGTPATWASSTNQDANWSNAPYGGSSTIYPNTWCCSFGATPSGTTSSDFSVLSTFNPTTIKFFTFAIGGVDDADDGHFNDGGNPGFEGIVRGGTVPEPATWTMMIAGFGLIGLTARRRAAAVA